MINNIYYIVHTYMHAAMMMVSCMLVDYGPQQPAQQLKWDTQVKMSGP